MFGLDAASLPAQGDRSSWDGMRERFAQIVSTRTRDGWVAAAEGTGACLTPVLTLEEILREWLG